jgi:predicted TPR repeat methyltransferase
MNPVKIKNKARECIERNQLAEARALVTTVCSKKPADADAWHLLGAINGMLGLNEEAETCARKVIKLKPDTVAAYNNLGSALLAQKRFDDAESVLEAALKLNPSDPQALNNSGNLLLQRKQFKKSADYFRKATMVKPDYAEAHNNLGSALLGMDCADEAIASLEKALQLAPGYPDALYNYGQAAYLLGKYDDALGAYGRTLELQPGHTAALLGAAEVLKLKGMHDQAANCYQSAINAAPKLTTAYIGYATLLQKQNKHTEAIQMLSRALEVDPECVDALHYSGASMKELGNIDAAAQFFSRALDINPELVQSRHMLAAIGLAEVPEKADARYVAELFDEYANKFDDHLVVGLEYRQPSELKELLAPLLGDAEPQLDVLDLGCGTGLCAPLFKPWSRSLTGVDLSRKMVAKAKERGLYDKLIVGDLVEPLSAEEGGYDLILATDVFVYLGKLDDVVRHCSQSMRQGGILAFSVELLQEGDPDYILHSGGRYAHTRSYIERLVDSSPLSIHAVRETVQRKEKGEDVKAIIFVLVKRSQDVES